MKVCILGTGRVGTHLCRAFMGAGHDVAVWNRSFPAAQQLAKEAGCSVVATLEALPADAEVILLSVKDDALETVARELANVFGKRKSIVAHTAGSKPMSLLDGLFPQIGVFYPMQTFSKGKSLDYSVIPFFVEANNENADTLVRLAESVSNNVYCLSSEQRRFLHLASVFACNFSNHCYTIASEILAEINVPFSVMLPLINETAEKVKTMPPCEAQTGPAARGDVSVLESQTRLLDTNKDFQKIYTLMSRDIMKHNSCNGVKNSPNETDNRCDVAK